MNIYNWVCFGNFIDLKIDFESYHQIHGYEGVSPSFLSSQLPFPRLFDPKIQVFFGFLHCLKKIPVFLGFFGFFKSLKKKPRMRVFLGDLTDDWGLNGISAHSRFLGDLTTDWGLNSRGCKTPNVVNTNGQNAHA